MTVDRIEGIRASLAYATEHFREPPVDAIQNALADADSSVRRAALEVLAGRIRAVGWQQACRARLSDSASEVRCEALRLLSDAGVVTFEDIAAALDSGDPVVAYGAMRRRDSSRSPAIPSFGSRPRARQRVQVPSVPDAVIDPVSRMPRFGHGSIRPTP